ncbi:hypothetical protein ACIPUD_10700 [Bradyrhizobium sp. CAR08]
MRRLVRALALACTLFATPVSAEQASTVLPIVGPHTMAEYSGLLNDALLALQTCHSGTTAPANSIGGLPAHYQCWLDTSSSPYVMKIYDSAQWVAVGKVNASAHTWTPVFQGSDTGTASTANTGTIGHTLGFLDTANTWSGGQSFNSGRLSLVGATSGSTALNASAMASGTLTLPSATDILVARGTTDTLTNKTINCTNNVCTVRLGSDVSGQLPVANGGTGASTAQGARASSGLNVDSFTGHGDSNYSIQPTDRVVGTNAAFTASRTWTVPAASAVNSGQAMIVADFAGTVTGSNTLIVARAGSDTINGGTSVTINSANGAYLLWSDGSSKWTAQAIGSSAASGVSSLDGATGAISTQSGSLEVIGSTLSSNVLSSRAFAATQDLSAFNVARTLGYATAGDRGDAIFVKVATNQRDVFVTAGTISQASSGCTNGTYRGLYFTGGTGANFRANVTVSGNVVSSVQIVEHGGNGYTVGDVLSPVGGNSSVGSCSGSAFTWTVSTVSSPLASFTDSGGNKWQYTVGSENAVNTFAFGCKWNWNKTTGDAGATNDTNCIKAAYGYANYASPNALFSAFGAAQSGTRVIWPAGTALICDTITQYSSVVVEGQGPQNSILKVCDAGLASGASANVYNICDPNIQLACFGPMLHNVRIDANSSTPANAGTYIVFSNAAQQNRILDNVTIYAGLRGCLSYVQGYGGAANANFYDVFCTVSTGAGSNGINVSNTGTTLINFKNVIVESGGSGFSGNGFNIASGQVIIEGYHTEGVTTGINVNMTTSTHSLVVKNASGGALCTELVLLQSANTVGNFSIENAVKNGCTRLVTDGQPSGTNRTADVTPANGVVAFNP